MKRVIPFLCVFMYFMSPYRLAGHELPEVVGILATILAILGGFRLHLEKSYVLFLAYMWIVPPIAGFVCGIPGNYLQALIPVALILSTSWFTLTRCKQKLRSQVLSILNIYSCCIFYSSRNILQYNRNTTYFIHSFS